MDQAVAEKVCTIREKVVGRIGANPFRTWFGGTTEFLLDGQRLDVMVGSAFVGSWINANYMPQLVEATREVIGGEPRVEIRINKDGRRARAADADGVTPALQRPASSRSGASKPAVRETRPMLRGELDDFVVGPSNELAFSIASAVARAPGQAFKHVVIHSGCGLGKTHLLQGICNAVSRAHPELSWRYVSGEEFTNEFIYGVKGNRIDLFRARFRNVDLLVIDDIHFLAHKQGTQKEFLYTFNAIDASGKTVVLSSDCHPRHIATLPEPLVNRLIAAMVVQIDPPDLATRREILRRRAATMLCELPDEVLDFLARHITRNVRELEGALFKLAAYATLNKQPLGLDLARRAVEEYLGAARPPEAAEIERVVAAYFGVTREALHSNLRDRTVAPARAIAMYLIRKHTRLSSTEIGRYLGNKQHSTVLMAVRRIEDLVGCEGAVAWKTPSGIRELPAKALLHELEQRLLRRQDAR